MPLPAAVLFDLDDTLFAHRDAVAIGILRHLEALGLDVDDPDAAVDEWHGLEERHYHRYLAGELAFEAQRRARAADFAAARGVALDDDAAGSWFDAYFEHYRSAWRLHDDALGCLGALRADRPDVRIGLITNGDLAFQRRKVEQVGLAPLVDLLVASGEVGVVKPDAAIFLGACDRLGVEPADAAYVGDRLRTDAMGAAQAGLIGVWLNRIGVGADADELTAARELGVIEITSLRELPSVLQGAAPR